jgi:hypothetical protein
MIAAALVEMAVVENRRKDSRINCAERPIPCPEIRILSEILVEDCAVEKL